MPALITYRTQVLEDWVDYNGHLRDAFYLLIFSYATDALMEQIGLDADSRGRNGRSLFTLEAHINYLHEVKLATEVWVQTQIIGLNSKRLHIYHSLHIADFNDPLAASEQMLLHVSLNPPKACPFDEQTTECLQRLITLQRDVPPPAYAGRTMSLSPRQSGPSEVPTG
ncbi:thioesterase [Pseudomonas sp. SGAir0191]|uniref:thioesterase family protein n=1 Tax=Pseudomonas TaxID=286 RepID=UPI00073444F7|nr:MULTISPECIES: thioesterase family protein [Pseudomonas]AUA34878.1 thioesterase [Pseudomonas sp. SGAir0191]KTT02587.1 4-hydroxybenzoyl-CoA thioesterase [Pseudomonas parafulva]